MGFIWRLHYKNRLEYFPCDRAQVCLKGFIEKNNLYNLYASSILFLIAMLFDYKSDDLLVNILKAILLYRFISRSFEITYAFGKDVLGEQKNSSGLNKFQRLRLAFKSYFELYLISASIYYYCELASGKLDSILMSLSVGSLTNVGYAVNNPYLDVKYLAFVQAFATLSLVVLSLAVYVSRAE